MTFAGFDPVETTTRPGRGLAIASPAIGASGLTPAVATSVLVLGALWFALLPVLSGAAVFATTSWRHVGPPVAYFDNRFSGPR